MELAALVIALVGIACAIFIPLRVEYEKRPRLRIERGDDANRESPALGPAWRIVHIKVVNEPITGRFSGRWLLRNVATGCRVQITLKSKSDGTRIGPFPGKWSAKPEPIQHLPVPAHDGAPATVKPFFDPQKQPGGFTLDLSPAEAGEAVAVAIKHDGDAAAYAYADSIYHHLPGPLKDGAVKLPHREYEVMVRAEAGEIDADEAFTLRNEGSAYTGLDLRS